MCGIQTKTKRKGGFTLVELVVTIAILSILAAIAIPMVVNIINSASQSSGDSQAATLTRQCSDVYAGVSTGTINNSDSKNADGSAVTFAVLKTATQSAKKSAANNVTVAQVKQYSGLAFDTTTDYYYCTAAPKNSGYTPHTIVFSDTGMPSVSGCTFVQLTDNTTLATILT